MKKSAKKDPVHEPVLTKEVIEYLRVKKIAHLKSQASPAANVRSFGERGRFIDATVGAAGHSIEIVKFGGEVLGIDQDSEMLKFAEKNLRKVRLRRKASARQACPTPNQNGLGSFKLLHGNFKDIDLIAKDNGFSQADGILFDLGVSSYHFDSKERGFSFSDRKAPLDMRMDQGVMGVTAADMLNSLPKDKLFKLFESVLPYQEARKLSSRIFAERSEHRIATVGDFSDFIKSSVTDKKKSKAPTKTLDVNSLPFMALRVAVNSELENLKEALPKSFNLLKRGGRLVVISFHSGEDKIVKRFFRKLAREGKAKLITKKPIVPKKDEIHKNQKARSAKMRVLENPQN